jgi:betaine lipid synthase
VPRCRPEYLTPEAFGSIRKQTDRVSIHTDELFDVVSSMAASSLTIAVIMDSMDWFEKDSVDALKQVAMLHRVLKVGGRVLLRSAGLRPWYLRDFEQGGFELCAAGQRVPGTCIDRVNMYASCWVCTKVA